MRAEAARARPPPGCGLGLAPRRRGGSRPAPRARSARLQFPPAARPHCVPRAGPPGLLGRGSGRLRPCPAPGARPEPPLSEVTMGAALPPYRRALEAPRVRPGLPPASFLRRCPGSPSRRRPLGAGRVPAAHVKFPGDGGLVALEQSRPAIVCPAWCPVVALASLPVVRGSTCVCLGGSTSQ